MTNKCDDWFDRIFVFYRRVVHDELTSCASSALILAGHPAKYVCYLYHLPRIPNYFARDVICVAGYFWHLGLRT